MELMEYTKTYQEYKKELDAVLTRTAEDFVQIGYLLKVARDTNVLAESGYATVTDFARAEYGIDKTQVSRFISINDRFSEDGYSDHLLPSYKGFGYAKLTLMLQIPDEINEALQTMVSRLEKLPPEAEEQSQTAGSFIVDQACAYMQSHYREKLTLQAVADRCYVSQWHLSKLLNRYTEKSFYDILNAIRIQKAKVLLSDPSLKIGEIGEMVGYTDTAHFARTFKKLEGMSANEFRNTLRI